LIVIVHYSYRFLFYFCFSFCFSSVFFFFFLLAPIFFSFFYLVKALPMDPTLINHDHKTVGAAKAIFFSMFLMVR
jgi:hypothetical protein